VRIKSDDDAHEIELEMISVRGQTAADNFYIIVFGETLNDGAAHVKRGGKKPAEKRNSTTSERGQAAREIKHSGTNLQALIEDHGTTLEEYKSANEEALSDNEELQSTNEELETAKEELQNRNAELGVSN
jgi:two-component system, chemotaxis family, CheB/CheR fusion protein